MARNLTSRYWEAVVTASTDAVYLILLTISHADLSEDITVCNDRQDVTSNGIDYIGFPFGFTLPNINDDLPRARLVIENVSRQIDDAVKAVKPPLRCKVQVVIRDDPDEVILEYPRLRLSSIQGNSTFVTADITGPDLSTAPYGMSRVTQEKFPGLYVR